MLLTAFYPVFHCPKSGQNPGVAQAYALLPVQYKSTLTGVRHER
ncbi:hypothetical protein IWX85_002788 [Polaromonas sp. CG_9.11]|nr:hypothetical protein [Polaromonas sp. CG_9.11]